MKPYDHSAIEKKWQDTWDRDGIYASREDATKPKRYVLDMFPYPSGDGLHVGHPKGYIATDVFSRHARMMGASVLHPMGWDAFGLPAENFAIKNKVHPRAAVEKNIARFKEQLKVIGLDYDWDREINTTDPEFYKWTQWIFLKLLEKGLAYESNEPINWCPTCQTGLSNEDLDGNECERCGTIVEKRPMRQWMLRITKYADRLLEDLEKLPEWQEHIKESQRNWIGRSEGAEVDFGIDTGRKYKYLYLHGYTSGADRPRNHWYRKHLEALGHEVVIPDLPNTDSPVEEEQVAAALAATTLDENTIVVGHSLGAIVAMKLLLKVGTPVAGLVLVAPAMPGTAEKDPKPFHTSFDWNFDWDRIKSLAKRRLVLSDLQETHRVAYLRDLAPKIDAQLVETTAVVEHFTGDTEPEVLMQMRPTIRVFTTRPDTLFGATYLVVAPEHALLRHGDAEHGIAGAITNRVAVAAYIESAAKKTELERQTEQKEKTGVRLEGISAVNPVNGERIPVYVADYVLGHYGTGAIMAVPAHDERDYAFATTFDLPTRQVIMPVYNKEGKRDDAIHRETVSAFVRRSDGKILMLNWPEYKWLTGVIGGIEEGETPEAAAAREVMEETGYMARPVFASPIAIESHFFAEHKNEWRSRHDHPVLLELLDDEPTAVAPEESSKHSAVWMTREEIERSNLFRNIRLALDLALGTETAYAGVKYGEVQELVNSGEFTGMDAAQAKHAITEQYGRAKTTYKIRDWVFSRQRYWGEPIPVIHCPHDGVVPVPEDQLPVRLPDVERYEPTGTGDSPLAAIDSWVNTTCPACGGPAKRETNTMPQWAGSSWYYLRYMDPKNDTALVDPEAERYWSPVDLYVGGAEHATRHLIYARFWHKFLFDIGAVSSEEPFKRLISVGLIMAEDGKKMSKRYGNVINPDDIVKQFGADSLRVYEMFMGPFTDAIAWNTNSMVGSRRFLERVWKLQEPLVENANQEVESLLHRTIRKVGDDIAAFKFNTAISQMMIFVNAAEKTRLTRDQYRRFLAILAPFAPHMTDELWHEVIGETGSIHTAEWPQFDAELARESTATIAVQVGGKTRTTIEMPVDASDEEVQEAARQAVIERLASADIKKVIVVKGRLVNFVLEE